MMIRMYGVLYREWLCIVYCVLQRVCVGVRYYRVIVYSRERECLLCIVEGCCTLWRLPVYLCIYGVSYTS